MNIPHTYLLEKNTDNFQICCKHGKKEVKQIKMINGKYRLDLEV